MRKPRQRWRFHWALAAVVAVGFAGTPGAQQGPAPSAPRAASDAPYRALVSSYCQSCHNAKTKAGGLELDAINAQDLGAHQEAWEKVVRKLRAHQMPPQGARQPDAAAHTAALSSLEAALDALSGATPNPGRTDTFRRLNRTEYRNAIRDLLALDIDVASLLPSDSASFGFDNVTVGNLSPTLLESYVGAAEKISRLAVGRPSISLGGATVRIKPDITQENHLHGLPIGTRGGTRVTHEFPLNGEYEIIIRLSRDRNEHIEGLLEPHEIELLLDDERLRLFTIEPVKLDNVSAADAPSHENLDSHLKLRVPVTAGPHDLTVTFLKKPFLLLETARRPYEAHFNYYRHPRLQPAVYEISIVGPYNAAGAGDTPSRRRVFVCQPTSARNEDSCAKNILTTLMRRAYRRPVNDADLKKPFELYTAAKVEGFDAGIEMGLSAVLSSPEFIFRIERDPMNAGSNRLRQGDGGPPERSAKAEEQDPAYVRRADPSVGTRQGVYAISDVELASRLSFFLWSSIPDDELLNVAARGDLSKPAVLDKQVMRMLADPKAENLVTNFASQWLHLRNLESITPDMRLYPDFDDNLRQAFRQETEMLVESVMREDRSVLDLVTANYTFVNERLAKHYGIPNIYGSRFRRIEFGEAQPASAKPGLEEDGRRRGGLLRQGSILLVTSYPTRTSPVIRGKWILENVLGVPPPPPPPDVPALDDVKTVKKNAPVRERLAEHRKNPTCAGCHRLTDPVGFALENYDAVGRWRTLDGGEPIDPSGTLFDGTAFRGVAGLQKAILNHPDLFVTTLSEKLLTFATGRGVAYYDAPAVRKIVRDARASDYRFSSIVLGVVNSMPFRMRKLSS
jgi:mono/diheme cytochrome c family protein